MKILNYILKMFTLLIENNEKEKYKEISIKKVFYRLFILFLLLIIIYRSCSIKLEKIEIDKNYKYFFYF